LLLTPLITPLVYAAGVDPIHFGIIVTVNLAIGMFMPPFGLNLFAAHALFRTPLQELYRGVLPFLAIYVVMLMLITYMPAITLVPLALLQQLGDRLGRSFPEPLPVDAALIETANAMFAPSMPHSLNVADALPSPIAVNVSTSLRSRASISSGRPARSRAKASR